MTVIHVPMSEAAEIIRDLLKAATDLGMDPTTTVKTSSDGVFGFSLIVPDEVNAQAEQNRSATSEPEPEPKPAKKTAAKKAAKKAAEPVVEEDE